MIHPVTTHRLFLGQQLDGGHSGFDAVREALAWADGPEFDDLRAQVEPVLRLPVRDLMVTVTSGQRDALDELMAEAVGYWDVCDYHLDTDTAWLLDPNIESLADDWPG